MKRMKQPERPERIERLKRARPARGLSAAALLFIFLAALTPSAARAADPAVVLKDVRYSASEDYVRVVLDLSAAARFDRRELNNSKKIYIDLKNTKVGSSFKRKIIDLGNPVLSKIRTGQFDSNTVRVVLDLENSADVKIFMLSSPDRIVVDVYGLKKDKAQEEKPPVKAAPPEKDKPDDKANKDADEKKPATDENKKPAAGEKEKPAAGGKDEKKVNEEKPEIKPEKKPEKNDVPAKDSPVKYEKKGNVTEKAQMLKTRKTRGAVETAKKKAEPAKPAMNAKDEAAAKPDRKPDKNKGKPLEQLTKRVVIDPGHGGHDTGAIGKNGLREKDVVLEISLLMAKILREKYHYEVFMTRSTDVFIPLEKRTEFANSKRADLFISVHVNANQEESVRGVETYFLNWTNNEEAMRVAARENDVTMKKMAEVQTELGSILTSLARESKRNESLRLANYVHREIIDSLNSRFDDVRDLGVKQALFYVLIGSSMPAALVELSFITNENEEKLLEDDAYKENLSEAITKGINHYIKTLPGAPAYVRAMGRKN
jgi:N-acetylmuramoyl-L-alanine amidase